jgi:hypothetical protein
MSTQPVRSFIVLAAVCLALLGTIPAVAQDTSDPVTIEKDRILIPGTNISEKDQRELTAILARYDKSLYKINSYVNGKLRKSQGTLPAAKIDKATAARAAIHAKDPHFTGCSTQVTHSAFVSNESFTHRTNRPGNTSNQSKPGNTTNQSKPGNTTNQDIPNPVTADASKAQELIKRLTPILRKYTKTQTAR